MGKYKTNITIEELESAINFAKKLNLEVITIEHISNPIGAVLLVSKDYDSEQVDITCYDRW